MNIVGNETANGRQTKAQKYLLKQVKFIWLSSRSCSSTSERASPPREPGVIRVRRLIRLVLRVGNVC